jgi:hypothetical protein
MAVLAMEHKLEFKDFTCAGSRTGAIHVIVLQLA